MPLLSLFCAPLTTQDWVCDLSCGESAAGGSEAAAGGSEAASGGAEATGGGVEAAGDGFDGGVGGAGHQVGGSVLLLWLGRVDRGRYVGLVCVAPCCCFHSSAEQQAASSVRGPPNVPTYVPYLLEPTGTYHGSGGRALAMLLRKSSDDFLCPFRALRERAKSCDKKNFCCRVFFFPGSTVLLSLGLFT